MIGQQPWRILKEFDCWVTRVWPNGSKAGGQNSGQDRTNPKSNNLIWNDATQLDLKPSQAIWPSHCPQPVFCQPKWAPKRSCTCHYDACRRTECATNDNNCGVNSKGLLSKFLGNKKYNIFPNSVSFSYCLLPQNYIRLFASRNRAQIFSSQVPMAGHTQRAVHGGKIHLIVMTISIAVEA